MATSDHFMPSKTIHSVEIAATDGPEKCLRARNVMKLVYVVGGMLLLSKTVCCKIL